MGLIGAAALTGEGGGEATVFFGDELTKGEDTILVGDMGSIGGAMVKFNLQRIRAIKEGFFKHLNFELSSHNGLTSVFCRGREMYTGPLVRSCGGSESRYIWFPYIVDSYSLRYIYACRI